MMIWRVVKYSLIINSSEKKDMSPILLKPFSFKRSAINLQIKDTKKILFSLTE